MNVLLPIYLLKTLDQLPEIDRYDVSSSINGTKQVLQNWADTREVDRDAAWKAKTAALKAEYAAVVGWLKKMESAEWIAKEAAEAAYAAVRIAGIEGTVQGGMVEASEVEGLVSTLLRKAITLTANVTSSEQIADNLILCIEEIR